MQNVYYVARNLVQTVFHSWNFLKQNLHSRIKSNDLWEVGGGGLISHGRRDCFWRGGFLELNICVRSSSYKFLNTHWIPSHLIWWLQQMGFNGSGREVPSLQYKRGFWTCVGHCSRRSAAEFSALQSPFPLLFLLSVLFSVNFRSCSSMLLEITAYIIF